MRRLLAALPLLFLAAGCPDSTTQSCPKTSTPLGDFTLTLNLQADHPQCRVTLSADGGPADADVAAAPASQSATVCAGSDPVDGGPTIFLAVGNRSLRQTPFTPDGSIDFTTVSTAVSQTVCGCPVDITEEIAGFLVPSTPGPFQFAPDGGLTPSVASISGTLTDGIASSATGCLCNVPCSLVYQLKGIRQ